MLFKEFTEVKLTPYGGSNSSKPVMLVIQELFNHY